LFFFKMLLENATKRVTVSYKKKQKEVLSKTKKICLNIIIPFIKTKWNILSDSVKVLWRKDEKNFYKSMKKILKPNTKIAVQA